MSDDVEITASFSEEETCALAIENLRESGFLRIRFFSPIPCEKLLRVFDLDRSPVRAWVLAAGIIGALSGFALTIGTSLTWSHVVGGKPIISMPPYIIIAFELMILCGGVTAVIAVFALGRLPQFETLSGFSSRFSSDRFGVVVRCAESEAAHAESILKDSGADQITRGAIDVPAPDAAAEMQ
jgi:hypothetical protein